MQRILLTTIVGVMLLVPARPGAQSDAPVFKLIRDYIEALRVQAGIPALAVAVVGRDNIVWEQAFGRQDVDRSVAARTDTPFHIDGLTQLFTASYLLRCVEEGRLSLNDRIGDFNSDVPEPNATIWQLLTHTSGPPGNPTFQYEPERLDPLTTVVRACAIESFRGSTMNIFDRLAMRDSVPGPDAPQLVSPAEGIPTPAEKARYAQILERLAVPYRVDQRRRATPSRYGATTLTPSGGLISTVHDLAQFDLAMKRGVLLLPETIAAAWTPADGGERRGAPARSRLVHGHIWRRADCVAIRRGRQRIIGADGDDTDPPHDLHPAGEQHRSGGTGADVRQSARGFTVLAGVAHAGRGIACR